MFKRGDGAERALRGRRGVELLLRKGGRTAGVVPKLGRRRSTDDKRRRGKRQEQSSGKEEGKTGDVG